jgi:two-component system response regulator YesN
MMIKILIVEDEDVIRKGLMFIPKWQEHGCTVAGEARNGQEGLERIRELQPDIVIVDINMPVMDGLQMMEKSISEFGYDAMVVSGYSEFDYARQALRLGVGEYLLKPVNYSELYDALDKIIAKRRERSDLRNDIRHVHQEKTRLGILDAATPAPEAANSRYVKMMTDRVRKDYQSRLSLTDISGECGVSCTYLNSKLKAATGYTFNDYLNRYRIQKAVEILKTQKYKIYEIADLVGFSDYKYFIKVFRKYTGSSPTEFMDAE